MEHQPFRMWLVDRSNLNEDEEEILRNHLAACTECTALEKDLAVFLFPCPSAGSRNRCAR
jgi:hypothetical protein